MSFAPSRVASNSTIQWCRGKRTSGPVLLDFPSGWGKGVVFDWYKSMRSTAVARVQLRKEYEEPFRHEFILVLLQGGDACRLDRRGDPNVPTQALSSTGSEAYDTVHEIFSLGEVESTSECLIELHPNGTIDLSFILSICFSIRIDPKTRRYTLQRFNCYFFSLTIASIVARHSVAWDTPVHFEASGKLTSTLKKKAVDPIAKKVADVVMTSISTMIIASVQPRLRKVLRKHLRPTGFIPTPVLHFVLSTWMRRNIRPRMVSAMRTVAESAMTTTLESTVKSLLDSRSSVIRTALSHVLWFDSIREVLRRTAQIALRDAIWALMVKTLKSAHGGDVSAHRPNLAPIEPVDSSSQSKIGTPTNRSQTPDTPGGQPAKPRVGGLLDTFFATGLAAISDRSCIASISSAWGMSDRLVGEAQTREEWNRGWDLLWSTSCEHAQARGRMVLNDIERSEGPDPARDEIWGVVWEELEVGFEQSSETVRDCFWEGFEYATDTVVGIVSEQLFAAFQESPRYSLGTVINPKPAALKKVKKIPHFMEANHSQLQEWIKGRIQKHGERMSRLGLGSAMKVQDDIREAMARVWEHVAGSQRAV